MKHINGIHATQWFRFSTRMSSPWLISKKVGISKKGIIHDYFHRDVTLATVTRSDQSTPPATQHWASVSKTQELKRNSRLRNCVFCTGNCREGVTGNQCSMCKPNHYGFSPDGCKECDCDPTGSTSPQCDEMTGQCECRDKVKGHQCTLSVYPSVRRVRRSIPKLRHQIKVYICKGRIGKN